MEWLANISVTYVIIAAIVLFIARMIIIRYDSPSAKSAKETVESVLVAIVLVFLVIRPFVIQAFFIPSESMKSTLLIGDRILVNKFIYRFREPRVGDVIVFKAPPSAAETDLLKLHYDEQTVQVPESEYKKQCNLVIGKVTSVKGNSGEVEATIDKYPSADFKQVGLVCLLKKGAGGKIYKIDKKTGKGPSYTLKFTGIDDASTAEYLVGAEVRIAERDYIKRLIGVPGDVLEVKNGKLYKNGKLQNEPYKHLESPPEPELSPLWDENHPGMAYNMAPITVPKGKVFAMGDNRNNSNDGHVWGPLDQSRILGKATVKFFPFNRIGIVH